MLGKGAKGGAGVSPVPAQAIRSPQTSACHRTGWEACATGYFGSKPINFQPPRSFYTK